MPVAFLFPSTVVANPGFTLAGRVFFVISFYTLFGWIFQVTTKTSLLCSRLRPPATHLVKKKKETAGRNANARVFSKNIYTEL
jgi:hypothetical protein